MLIIRFVNNVFPAAPDVKSIVIKKNCHSEEPSGDEGSPKIILVLLVRGFFVTSFLRMTQIT